MGIIPIVGVLLEEEAYIVVKLLLREKGKAHDILRGKARFGGDIMHSRLDAGSLKYIYGKQ